MPNVENLRPEHEVIANPDDLPTPLAQVVRRVETAGNPDSADRFLAISYVAEVTVKLAAIALVRSLERSAPDHCYQLSYEVVRADGLGTWDQVIRTATNPPVATFHPRGIQPLVAWATKVRTKAEDTWFREAAEELSNVFDALYLESPISERKPTVRDLVSALVQLRNKTKAHGAVGPNFFRAANPSYAATVSRLVEHCPLYRWPWLRVRGDQPGAKAGLWLSGLRPKFASEDRIKVLPVADGRVAFWPPDETHPVDLGLLVEADAEANEFLLPNGGFTPKGQASYLDYLRGRERGFDRVMFLRPPAPLPASETEGLSALVVQSNAFGNLPDLPRGYVARQELEGELMKRVLDRNHPIVTLHGRGGDREDHTGLEGGARGGQSAVGCRV